jgi:hypothetical protein
MLEMTYQPDDSGVVVSFDGQHVSAVGRPDCDGVQKWTILEHRHGKLIVDHERSKTGGEPVDVVPWAITHLAPGAWCYRDERFSELETLDPGGTASHREVWMSLSIGENDVEDMLTRFEPNPVTMLR